MTPVIIFIYLLNLENLWHYKPNPYFCAIHHMNMIVWVIDAFETQYKENNGLLKLSLENNFFYIKHLRRSYLNGYPLH